MTVFAGSLAVAGACGGDGAGPADGDGGRSGGCGVADPETGMVGICSPSRSEMCVCATGRCAMIDLGCGSSYRYVTGLGECVRLEDSSVVIRSDSQDDLCPTGADGDGDGDGDADADSDDEAEVSDEGEDGPACESGTPCGTDCVDLETDPDHCGTCENDCPGAVHAHAVCAAWSCDTECDDGWVDLDDDGDCDYACTPATPSDEVCNDVDDDCDGDTDEDFGCRIGASESCTTTCGTTGAHSCSAACAWDPCTPPHETCDGTDQDCDGVADDGLYGATWDIEAVEVASGWQVVSFSPVVAAGEIAVGHVLAASPSILGQPRMSRFDEAGAPFGGADSLSSDTTIAAIRAAGSVAIASFVWDTGNDLGVESAQIRSAELAGSSSTLGNRYTLDPSAADLSRAVDVARMQGTDTALAAWIEVPVAGAPEVRLALVSNHAMPVVDSRYTITAPTPSVPDVAIALDSVVDVVWLEGVSPSPRVVRHWRFDMTLAPSGSAADVSSAGGRASGPRVAANGDRFLVVWDEDSPAEGIGSAVLGTDGTVLASGILVTGASVSAPVVAPDLLGGFAVAYRTSSGVEIVRVSASGEVAGAPIAFAGATRPEITAFPDGDLVLAYDSTGNVRLARIGCTP